MKSVYIETSIPSYLTARPSRDVRAAAWQELTVQWGDAELMARREQVAQAILALQAALAEQVPEAGR